MNEAAGKNTLLTQLKSLSGEGKAMPKGLQKP
jgi:hypothetical protein